MKTIGRTNTKNVLIEATDSEWSTIQRAAGIPYDKRSETGEINLYEIDRTMEALSEMKTFRRELGKLQKKWDDLATRIDAILGE